jgi:hypothetical protein
MMMSLHNKYRHREGNGKLEAATLFSSAAKLSVMFWPWIKRALPGGEEVCMLGLVALCWATWTTRNSICFDKKEFRNPCEIIFLVCVKQEMIEKGVQTMIRVAMQILEKKHPVPAPRLMLTEGEATDDDQDNGEDQVDHLGA